MSSPNRSAVAAWSPTRYTLCGRGTAGVESVHRRDRRAEAHPIGRPAVHRVRRRVGAAGSPAPSSAGAAKRRSAGVRRHPVRASAAPHRHCGRGLCLRFLPTRILSGKPGQHEERQGGTRVEVARGEDRRGGEADRPAACVHATRPAAVAGVSLSGCSTGSGTGRLGATPPDEARPTRSSGQRKRTRWPARGSTKRPVCALSRREPDVCREAFPMVGARAHVAGRQKKETIRPCGVGQLSH
jgi:hypothetical protein